MKLRPDHRKYARVTRKLSEIVDVMRRGKKYKRDDIYEEVTPLGDTSEFFLTYQETIMSPERFTDYVAFAVKLDLLTEDDGTYSLAVQKPTSDLNRAQLLADQARNYIAKLLGQKPSRVIPELQRHTRSILSSGKLPTLDRVSAEFGIPAGRAEERFRWAVYVLLDEPNSDLRISYSPILQQRSDE